MIHYNGTKRYREISFFSKFEDLNVTLGNTKAITSFFKKKADQAGLEASDEHSNDATDVVAAKSDSDRNHVKNTEDLAISDQKAVVTHSAKTETSLKTALPCRTTSKEPTKTNGAVQTAARNNQKAAAAPVASSTQDNPEQSSSSLSISSELSSSSSLLMASEPPPTSKSFFRRKMWEMKMEEEAKRRREAEEAARESTVQNCAKMPNFSANS